MIEEEDKAEIGAPAGLERVSPRAAINVSEKSYKEEDVKVPVDIDDIKIVVDDLQRKYNLTHGQADEQWNNNDQVEVLQ